MVYKINLILSLFCLKEEYPKEFFIDYILDETYTERGANKTKNKKRQLGVFKEEPFFMADDFDETPECFKEYV